MSFRSFIYYCAMLGGCAAFIGWMLGRMPSIESSVLETGIKGLFLGMMVALNLAMLDAVWNFNPAQLGTIMGRIFFAFVLGCVGGFFGGALGQILTNALRLSPTMIVGWTLTGCLIGAAPGAFDYLIRLMSDEDTTGVRKKLVHGILGGTVGGLIGGSLYFVIGGVGGLLFRSRPDLDFWTPPALGFIVLGMCIGLLIGAAQVILKEAWLRVEKGFRAGRELILTKPEVTIGRGEGNDIGLFGDSGVDKIHARIVKKGNRFILEDRNTEGGTYLNGELINGPTPLRSGDVIQVGNSTLRFGERQKRTADA